MAKIKVGDPLFIIDHYGRTYEQEERRSHAIVTKVGTRYLEAVEVGEQPWPRRWNLSIETLGGKDVNDHARAWASEADYEAFKAAKVAWEEFHDRVVRKGCREPKPGVSVDDIHAAMRLLKIEVK